MMAANNNGNTPVGRPNPNASPKAGGVGYIFDIIVVRLDITDKEAKQLVESNPNALYVQAKFIKAEMNITSSRINVVEFKSGKSYEFCENPSVLRDDLTKNQLRLRVMFGHKELALTLMDWPDGFKDRLVEPDGPTELTHVFESELKNCESGKVCGVIEVIVRLQTKCREWTNEDLCTAHAETVCKEANKIIEPNDILFVVGEDRNPCCCSQVSVIPASESSKDLHPTCLDLSNFRSINGQTVPNMDVLQCVDPACSELENITTEYQHLIDNIITRQKPQDKNTEKEQSPCCARLTQHHRPPDYASMGSAGIDDNNQIGSCRCCMDGDNRAFAGDNIVNVCQNDMPPALIERFPVDNRFCPLCQENLSWLPKLAACPKCGYKPIPLIEERKYDDDLTAEDILKQCQRKSSCTMVPSDQRIDNKDDTECRCSCQPQKECTHCRVRKMCSDVMYNTNQESGTCGKCENTSSAEDMAFNVCHTEGKDCRPHLSRVFSELKDLYDIRECKKKGPEIDERCEKELKSQDKRSKGKGQKQKRSKRKKNEFEKEREEFTVDNYKTDSNCKSKKTYNYHTVRKYPGHNVGHKTCINGFAGRKCVPPHMGWLWNVEATGLRSGWKPGAIRKPIKELMKYFLKDFPADTLRVSQYSYRKTGSIKDDCEDLVQKPTLHICKKNAEYYITLRPLKDPEELKTCADPYLNMKPIQFRITENPLRTERRKLKKCLKDMGFNKCTCHKPIIHCYCRNFLDKKRLEYQCNKEARNRNIPPCTDTLVLSDTTDSETEFDFGVTPPAGVVRPERLKRRNYVNTATQYEENDWNIPPLFPKQPNKYMKLYNCAIGERFGKAFGPYGPGGYKPGAVPGLGPCPRGGIGPGNRNIKGRKGGYGFAMPVYAKGRGTVPQGATRNVDMLRYLQKRQANRLSPAEIAEKRKKQYLTRIPPPLLCMIQKQGKGGNDPYNPYVTSAACHEHCCGENRIC